MRNRDRAVGRTPGARRRRLPADALPALPDTQPRELIAAAGREEGDRARLYGRTATGLLRYHHWLADTSPGRIGWLLGVRASMMAANLLACTEALVHAGNGHLQRDRSSMQMGGGPVPWWSAGAIVAAELGEAYAFLAGAVGTIRHHGVQDPPPDTIEGMLYALPGDPSLVDPRGLAVPPARRESPWYGYAPLDPAQLSSVDAIVFVKDIPDGPAWWPTGA